MVKLVNRAKMLTNTVGTGSLTLVSPAAGFQSFAAAGIVDGDAVRYVIEDGVSWEIGVGIYAASGTLLTRTVSESSNNNLLLSLSGNAMVYVSATASDVTQLSGYDIQLTNATAGDLLGFDGVRWYNRPATDVSDGGNF